MTTHALVLSGGGPVGIAWEAGLLAGLAEAGVDLSASDLIVGTSAGSVVGVQLALGTSPREIAEEQLAPSVGSRPGGERAAAPEISEELLAAFLGGDEDPVATRRRLGRFARDADTMPEEEFVASFGTRLGEVAWPPGFVCTTVDAESGSFVAFDADGDAPLARAVAASCAVPGIYPPVTIGGRRYMDGGVRSLTNADLAVGHDEVVVLSLLDRAQPGADPDPLTARQEAEIATLGDAGATVRLFAPDAAAREQLGMDLMDFSRRAEAAEAGLVQGRAEGARLGS